MKAPPQTVLAAISPIRDLRVEKASENFIILSWTAPSTTDTNQPVAAYAVKISANRPVNNGFEGTIFDPHIVPKAPGAKETVKISNLKPGSPYYIAVRSLDRYGRASNDSEILSTGTQIAFVDEDLDPHDPFVSRDPDSLFVADNDMSLCFVWSPAEGSEGTVYRVRVFAEEDKTVLKTHTVTSAEFTYEAPEEGSYSIEVTPLLGNGEILPAMKSRAIRCSPQGVEPPGKPIIIMGGGQ
ncbi:MAG: fibronectin type III domain-containing protein [Candidatus Latescibacterota bacterium]